MFNPQSKTYPIVVAAVALLVFVGLVYFVFINPVNGSPDGMTYSITTVYADGETKTDRGNMSPFLPQKVIDDPTGREVYKYDYTLTINPTYTGIATSTKVTGNVVISIGGVTKVTTPISYTSQIQSGQPVTVVTGTLFTSTMEGWSSSAGQKTVTLSTNITFEATYAGGVQSKTGTATANIVYTVQPNTGTITGLSIVFHTQTYLSAEG